MNWAEPRALAIRDQNAAKIRDELDACHIDVHDPHTRHIVNVLLHQLEARLHQAEDPYDHAHTTVTLLIAYADAFDLWDATLTQP